MKRLHILLLSFTSLVVAAPKLSYIQRPDERAPFIYITVINDQDNGREITQYRREQIYHGHQDLKGNVTGNTYSVKEKYSKADDIIVFPRGSKVWNWHAHTPHTHHHPGILPADVKELVEEHKVDIVILSKGVEEVLQTDPSTIEYLKKNKKHYYILETRKAIDKYNELIAQGKKVGGLFHTTC